MGWGAFAAALGGGIMDAWSNNYNAKKQDERTLRMYRLAPQHQMQGFADAGLNPMLAYSRMDFPNSSAGYTPTSFTTGITQSMQASASMESAQAATSQASSSARQASVAETRVKAEVDKMGAETRKTLAEAGISEASERQISAFIRAIARQYGVQIIEMSESDEAISKFMGDTRVRGELASVGAAVAENLNREELHKFLNMPAANALMQAAQVALRFFMLKGK